MKTIINYFQQRREYRLRLWFVKNTFKSHQRPSLKEIERLIDFIEKGTISELKTYTHIE